MSAPRLPPSWRKALRSEGLTEVQLDELDKAVGKVAEAVDSVQPKPAEVAESANRLAHHLNAVRAIALSRGGDSADAAAWGRVFGEFIGTLVDRLREDGVELPTQVKALGGAADPHWYIGALAEAAGRVSAGAATERAKPGRRAASPDVVSAVLVALARDRSERGRELTARCYPTRGHKGTSSPFPAVLRAVLEAATGREHDDIGAYVRAWKAEREPRLKLVLAWDTESPANWMDCVSLL